LQKNKSLLAVNSADDQVNPPELGLMEKYSVGKKRKIYPAITDLTSGHGTHSNPTIWEILRRVTY
jgi:homoserine O-acetyltransferase